ncbi:hypothetical protein [Haliangium sp.]|uniref:hypothetical protein n=1 Tax=Haliangium sp. TaxID=2663208 RepID=UPI003D12CB36
MQLSDKHLGELVQYEVNGDIVFFGILEHITEDGWAGIRQPHDGNRLDEAPADLVKVDPS